MNSITRRALLAGTAAAAGCARRKGSGYPGHAFVANAGGRSVAAVNLETFSVARRIALDGAPAQVAADARRRAVYVLVPESGTVCEIDSARLAIRRTVRVGGAAVSMRLASDGASLWVLAHDPNALVRVRLEDLKVGGRMRLPAAGADFDLGKGGTAAVSFAREGQVGMAGVGDTAMEALIGVGAAPGTVRFQQNGAQVLIGNRGSRTVTIANVQKRRVVVNLPVPLEPVNFCSKYDGGEWFISGSGMDAVVIVYPYSTEVAETVLAGKAPENMAVLDGPATAANYLFVSNPQSATVTVLDIFDRRLVAAIGVGQEPGQIVFTPDFQYALVLNRGSGDVAIIRIPSMRVTSEGKLRRYKGVSAAPLPVPLFNLIPVGTRPVSAAVV
jgi:DNA-binding beta-propeller fold protein YncE